MILEYVIDSTAWFVAGLAMGSLWRAGSRGQSTRRA